MMDWSLAQLEVQAAQIWPGLRAELVQTIASTNSELMLRGRAGQLDPVLLLAQSQSAGRGRMGRLWHSEAAPGASLTFSLGLPLAPRDWSGLSLAVGVSLARSLEPVASAGTVRHIGLKWPNDLWWQGRKLGGVLIETLSSGAGLYAVIGVGLNIRLPRAGEFATAPAALNEFHPDCLAPDALRLLLLPLLQAIASFADAGFAPLRDAYGARDVLLGQEVQAASAATQNDTPPLVGIARGVDESGALLLHTAQGMTRISSSEVSIRPGGQRQASPPAS